MESVSLAAFLRGTRLATSDQNMLAKFCLQAAHFYPWAVVLVLDSGQQTSDLDFGKSFWFCARDLRCGTLMPNTRISASQGCVVHLLLDRVMEWFLHAFFVTIQARPEVSAKTRA